LAYFAFGLTPTAVGDALNEQGWSCGIRMAGLVRVSENQYVDRTQKISINAMPISVV
jgi:hypothetical protein